MLAIAVLARRPVAGSALPHLVPPLAPAEAARLGRAIFEDVLGAVRTGAPEARHFVAYGPRDAEAWFAGAVSQTGGSWILWPQPDGEADERLTGTLAMLHARGNDHLLLVGAESPELTAGVIAEAAAALTAGADVVIGPLDESSAESGGGFYLLGLSRRAYESLDGVPTEAACREAGLARTVLPRLRELASVPDLERLFARLAADLAFAPATRKLLVAVGKLAG